MNTNKQDIDEQEINAILDRFERAYRSYLFSRKMLALGLVLVSVVMVVCLIYLYLRYHIAL